MITVYITFQDMAEARKIATSLLEKKLIVCANMFPVYSMFSWKGKIDQENEVAMICKAAKENFTKIDQEVKKLHSYQLPCVVAFEWHDSNKDFSKWVGSGG